MTTLQKAIPTLNKIFIRILIVFFTELEKKGPKFIWKHKDPEEPKQTSGEGATLSISQWLISRYMPWSYDSKIKDGSHKQTHTPVEQSTGLRNKCTQLSYSHLIFDEGVKNTLPKKTARSENAWNTGYSHVKDWEQWAGNAAPLHT